MLASSLGLRSSRSNPGLVVLALSSAIAFAGAPDGGKKPDAGEVAVIYGPASLLNRRAVPAAELVREPAEKPSVMGSLDIEVIRRIVLSRMSAVRGCLELADGGVVTGKVVVKFIISPAGSVTSSKLVQSTVGNAALEDCVVAAMMPMKFPAPLGGGIVVVTYPFVFAAPK